MGKLLACLLTAACAAYVYSYIPPWVVWNEKTEALPANPGLIEGTVTLKDRQVVYASDDGALWKTDPSWKISDMMIEDIDDDGWCEIVMLSWTRGQYGDYQPVYEKPNRWKYTQRLYIFNLYEDRLQAQWMSSQLKPQVRSWQIKDGLICLTDASGDTTVWKWQGRSPAIVDRE